MMRTAAVVMLLALAAPARADDEAILEPPPPPPPTPFDQGKFTLGLYGGRQTTLGYRKFAIGGAFGYFVLDGLEVGLGAQHQFGDGPSISQLTPALRYVAQPLLSRSPVVPYVGVFYNHWFIGDGIDDVDTVGSRAGLVYVSGKVIFGLGVAYERVVSECVTDCSDVYPDFTLAFSL